MINNEAFRSITNCIENLTKLLTAHLAEIDELKKRVSELEKKIEV